jgi:plasmid replication initiation protein
MAYPFFSLAKTHRTTPIDFRMHEIAIRVEAVPEHGMATIWDADVLIWAASQIVEARDAGLRTSRLMVTTPREILTFTRRGTGARDYHRLKAALDRLQSTTVATSLRQTGERRMHRFSWINEWTERADAHSNADGIDLIMPDWFYRAVLDDALVLTIDPAYFGLTGGLERWLYRLVRKHAGHQRGGWRFDLRHLHVKSASLPGSPIKLSDTAAWRWISGQDGGSRSVLYHATRSICWCCTLGESEYRAMQPPRVRSLVLGQGGALPPDTVAGGETRDAA